MAGIRFTRLVANFADTLERLGGTVIVGSKIDHRPARMRVSTADTARLCDVYLWTIKPDAPSPPRPPDSFKVQFENPESHPLTGFPLLPGIRTIVGGWSVEHGVYAFWDARRHVRFGRSPNCQVKGRTLTAAYHKGIATQIRETAEGQEVVVALKPDSLLWYVMEGEPLHNTGEDIVATVEDLVAASVETEREFLDADHTEAGAARRYDLVQIMRAFREARFRPEVLRAYSYRCTVCQTALKLVDAAHIIPVAHLGSTEGVDNGLALCRLHHAAYDNALLGVRSDLSIITNPALVTKLRALGLIAGWEEFRDRLPPSITPPTHPDNRPRPQNLITGLRARQWADDLIG